MFGKERRAKREKGEGEKEEKGDLSRWAAGNGAQARDQKNGLFEGREIEDSRSKRREFQLFPRAVAEFRPSGYSLDLLVLLDQAKRTIKTKSYRPAEIQRTPPEAQAKPEERPEIAGCFWGEKC